MARMIPATVHKGCMSPGEQEIFRRLKDDPSTRDWIVLHSLDIANHRKQVSGEVDFLIIVPSKGVLCLEVKACSSLRRVGGSWYYGSDPSPDTRGPFKQASEAMHSIRSQLISQRPDLSRVVFWSAVIFPYVQFSYKSTEWHPWQVIDARAFRSFPISKLIDGVLDNAREFLLGCPSASWFQITSKEPYKEQCEDIAETLRPSFEVFEDPRSRTLRLNSELKRYTEEQFIALDAMEANMRVIFTGPAGTGKTLLAIEAVRRGWAKGNRVLFICFNRLLGKWLEEQNSGMYPQVVTRTIHSHMLKIAGLPADDLVNKSDHFWENELPLLAIEKLIDDQVSENIFDEIIIDETQDILRENYLDFLDLSIKGGLYAGKWRFYGDFEKQAIYGASNMSLNEFLNIHRNTSVYTLRVNCRNSPRVATMVHLLGDLNPGYTRVLRPDDRIEPELHYYSSSRDQPRLLIEVLDKLYTEGFKGRDVVILSPRGEKACATIIDTSPWKDRIKPFDRAGKGNISYSTIQAFKGLEAPAVIITDIDHVSSQNAKALFYIAITRALHRLVILASETAKTEIINSLIKLG